MKQTIEQSMMKILLEFQVAAIPAYDVAVLHWEGNSPEALFTIDQTLSYSALRWVFMQRSLLWQLRYL